MGHEVTLPRDCDDSEFLLGTLLRLSDQVGRRLRGEGFTGRVVAVKIRDSRFRTLLRQRALESYTDDARRIFEVARALFLAHWKRDPVRLVGVTVATLERRRQEQAELFANGRRDHDWRAALDRVRDKLGEASLVPAATLTHRRELGHVPFGAVGPAIQRREAGKR
jgi:DNA polymerase-4